MGPTLTASRSTASIRLRKTATALALTSVLVGCAVAPAAQAAAQKKVARAKLADTAKNARLVDKLSASKLPKAGQLLALDA